jgi:hypothetical protein
VIIRCTAGLLASQGTMVSTRASAPTSGRHQPAADREPARLLSQQPRIQLVAGQQEQEAQPDVGQQLDARRVGQAEHVRADQHAAEQEDDHLRDARTRQHGDDERRERRHQRHRHQVVEAFGQVHPRSAWPNDPVLSSPIREYSAPGQKIRHCPVGVPGAAATMRV